MGGPERRDWGGGSEWCLGATNDAPSPPNSDSKSPKTACEKDKRGSKAAAAERKVDGIAVAAVVTVVVCGGDATLTDNKPNGKGKLGEMRMRHYGMCRPRHRRRRSRLRHDSYFESAAAASHYLLFETDTNCT